MKTIEAVATTSGSRADVWALLADAATWAQWGSWSKVVVEGEGPQALGEVRVLVKSPYRLRERITEWVPGERTGYEHAGPVTTLVLRLAVRDACKRLTRAASV